MAILRRAVLSVARVEVARVRCSARCQVSVTVDDGRTLSTARTSMQGTRLVGVSRRRVHAGPLGVEMYVDGGPLLRGRSRL